MINKIFFQEGKREKDDLSEGDKRRERSGGAISSGPDLQSGRNLGTGMRHGGSRQSVRGRSALGCG